MIEKIAMRFPNERHQGMAKKRIKKLFKIGKITRKQLVQYIINEKL